jgi:hypothetical protein
VVTNAGNVFRLSHFPGKSGRPGVWQRVKGMETGEQPEWWTDLPNSKDPRPELGDSL